MVSCQLTSDKRPQQLPSLLFDLTISFTSCNSSEYNGTSPQWGRYQARCAQKITPDSISCTQFPTVHFLWTPLQARSADRPPALPTWIALKCNMIQHFIGFFVFAPLLNATCCELDSQGRDTSDLCPFPADIPSTSRYMD